LKVKLTNYFNSLRIFKWYKNILILLPSLLGLGVINTLFNPSLILSFIIFGILSSGLYIINDVIDIKIDREHPTKKNRPIASGRIPMTTAISFGGYLILFSLVFFINNWLVFLYFLSTLSYSLLFKKIVVVDCVMVSFNSILRLLIGFTLVNLPIELGLIILFFFITMITSLSKRLRMKKISSYPLSSDTIIFLLLINSLLSISVLSYLYSFFGIPIYLLLISLIIRLVMLSIKNPLLSGSYKVLIKDTIIRVILFLMFIFFILRSVL